MNENTYNTMFLISIMIIGYLLSVGIGISYVDDKWKNDIIEASIQTDKPKFLLFTLDNEDRYFKIDEVNINNFNNYVNISNITIEP